MHLSKRTVKGNTYFSLCKTEWDPDRQRPREKTLLYLGKTPVITEEQAKQNNLDLEELEQVLGLTILSGDGRTNYCWHCKETATLEPFWWRRHSVRCPRCERGIFVWFRAGRSSRSLPYRIKRVIEETKSRIPDKIWDDFKHLGFHLRFEKSRRSFSFGGIPEGLAKPVNRNKALPIRLDPDQLESKTDEQIKCVIGEEIAHQWLRVKRETDEGDTPDVREGVEEEVWVLWKMLDWGFPLEEVQKAASEKGWLYWYAIPQWGQPGSSNR